MLRCSFVMQMCWCVVQSCVHVRGHVFEHSGADITVNGFNDISDIVLEVRKSEGDVITDIDCSSYHTDYAVIFSCRCLC